MMIPHEASVPWSIIRRYSQIGLEGVGNVV